MSDFYKVIQVEDNIFRITSYEAVFCEVIVGKEKAMLIDTGYAFGDLKKVISTITDLPLIIVNTHGHVDHVCGNRQFDGPVYIGAEDIELCISHSETGMRKKSVENAKHAMDWSTGQEVYGLPADFDYENYIKGGSGELVSLNEEHEFNLGGATICVYHTPGHTRGGYSFYYKEKKLLYAGDAANPFLWLFAPEATDRATHIATLEKIMKIPFAGMYGGHAPFPMSHQDVSLFIKVAQEADYSKGEPFYNPIIDAADARVCCLEGMTMKDIGKPGFASIVLREGD